MVLASPSASAPDTYGQPLHIELSRSQTWEAINGLIDRRRLLEADIRAAVARGDQIHPETHRTLLSVQEAETALRAAIQIPDDDLRTERFR